MSKILLVDDNAGEVRLISETLKEMKSEAEIDTAKDGEQAVRILESGKSERPDLILLDLKLPRKSGKEVLEEIKKNTELAFIPVVILTSSDSDKDRTESLMLGADAFLSKPSALADYASVLAEALKYVRNER